MASAFSTLDLSAFSLPLVALAGLVGVGCIYQLVCRARAAESALADLAVANAELSRLAGSDGLTGLANRRRFDERLEEECRRAARQAQPVSLLLLDVDRFKSFNDQYGHQAGDECLKRIAKAIGAFGHRPTDIAARYGGEELALMLPGTGEESARQIAEQAREAVERLGISHIRETGQGVVTISIGCATLVPPVDGLAAAGSILIAEADRALYEAKRLGRNRVATASEMQTRSASKSEEDRLRLLDSYANAGCALPSDSVDRVARMASVLLGMPGAFVTLVGRDEVFVIGQHGLEEEIGTLTHAFCRHALGGRSPLVVPDASIDPRFSATPAGKALRFVAAAPLSAVQGHHHLGALWVADRLPRPALDETKRALLARLADLVVEDLVVRHQEVAPASPLAA